MRVKAQIKYNVQSIFPDLGKVSFVLFFLCFGLSSSQIAISKGVTIVVRETNISSDSVLNEKVVYYASNKNIRIEDVYKATNFEKEIVKTTEGSEKMVHNSKKKTSVKLTEKDSKKIPEEKEINYSYSERKQEDFYNIYKNLSDCVGPSSQVSNVKSLQASSFQSLTFNTFAFYENIVNVFYTSVFLTIYQDFHSVRPPPDVSYI